MYGLGLVSTINDWKNQKTFFVSMKFTSFTLAMERKNINGLDF